MSGVSEGAAAIASPVTASSDRLSDEARVAAYRLMVLARAVDERCLSLQRQGRIGFYAPLAGQEAAQVGSATGMEPVDWVFPAYREMAVALYRGVPLARVFHQLIGNALDVNKGRQMPNHFAFQAERFVSASSPIGTQISQAVGTAMAIQRRKDSIAAITYFGDGATSSNDFHAGLNFAGVFRAPVIFFCQNNEWAISLPRERQTRSATLAEKAAAYGFPGVVVDGNDLDAVHEVVRAARLRAVAGEGPTLIEAQVYRFGPHSTSDDPRRYRSQEEVDAARKNDPILKLREKLSAGGLWTDDAEAALTSDVKAQVVAALEAAEKAPPLDPASIFDDVFATPSPRLESERAEWESLVREGVLKS